MPLRGLVLVLLALPWLNPFAPGPSPAFVPWLTGAACGLALWALTRPRGARIPRAAALALLPALAAVVQPSHAADWMLLSGSLLLILLHAAAARSLRTGWMLGLLAAAALSAIMALAQAFGLAAPLWPWISGAQIGEAYGNLRQPNQFGSLCWLGIAVLLWGRPRLKPALAWALALLLGLAAAASASRTAAGHALLLGLLLALWPGADRRRAAGIWGVAVAAFVAGALLLPTVIQAATGTAPARSLLTRIAEGAADCSSRRVLWENVLYLIAQRPWAGWGWGELDFAHFWALYPQTRFCFILDNAHNLPLHMAVEFGLPAAGIALAGAALWVVGRRPWAACPADHRLAWAMLAIIGLHSLLEYPLWYAPFQAAAGCALGLLWRDPASRSGDTRQWSLAGHGLVLVLAGVLAWCTWDYGRVSQAYRAPEQRWPSMRDDPAGRMAGNWLFGQQARFAQLWSVEVMPSNAARVYPQTMELLHYSPEPRVIEQAIAAARLSGHGTDADAIEQRYRLAFPERWAAWKAGDQR